MKEAKNIVFLAKSLDNFIAGPEGELDWLDMIANPDGDDMGYFALIEEIDAIVMGRKSFEKVLSFGIEWPYKKPVFVLSRTLNHLPENLENRVFLLKGSIEKILSQLHEKGHKVLYIDGGQTTRSFLQADRIDELRITTLPIILGNGIPLFDVLSNRLTFEHIKTEVFLGQLVQSHYKRKDVDIPEGLHSSDS